MGSRRDCRVLDTTNNQSIEKHIQDTIDAGDGLCDEDIVRVLYKKLLERIQSLINEGVDFDRSADGSFDLVKEGGHQEKESYMSKIDWSSN